MMVRILIAFAFTLATFPALAQERRDAGVEALSEILVEGSEWHVAVDRLGFADGLSYDAAGNVFFADLRGDNAGVYKLAPDGTKSKLYTIGRSGTRLGPDGKLYACGGKTLVAIDPDDRKVTTIADDLGTNDLAVAPSGHVFITDHTKKQVTVVDPRTGKSEAADKGITAPNGIGLSPDGKTLYVSDYGGVKVWAFQVNPNGTLARKKALMTMNAPKDKPTVAGGDGLTVDADGRCYVTSALGIQVFDKAGQHLGTIPKPGNGPLVSAGFGGKGLDHLYAACGDKIYRRKTRTTGAAPVSAILSPPSP